MTKLEIRETTDYFRFQLVEGNRVINKNHVRRLKDSIELEPELLKSNPIQVNEDMEIMDGQHRWTAAKELGVPISYIVVPGITLHETRVLNATQRRWSLMDFARSYADSGKHDYKVFLEASQKYPHIQSTAIEIILAGSDTHRRSETFARGEFTVGDLDKAEKTLERLEQIAKVSRHRLNVPMVSTFLSIEKNNPDFDYDRFITKLDRDGGREMFRNQSTIRLCLQSIENVYNFHNKSPLRLY